LTLTLPLNPNPYPLTLNPSCGLDRAGAESRRRVDPRWTRVVEVTEEEVRDEAMEVVAKAAVVKAAAAREAVAKVAATAAMAAAAMAEPRWRGSGSAPNSVTAARSGVVGARRGACACD